jgi:hypothetical protein
VPVRALDSNVTVFTNSKLEEIVFPKATHVCPQRFE